MENKRVQWNLDLRNGQGIEKNFRATQRRFPSKFIENPYLVYEPRVLLDF